MPREKWRPQTPRRWWTLPSQSPSRKWNHLHLIYLWWGHTTWRWKTWRGRPGSHNKWRAAHGWNGCGRGGWWQKATCGVQPCCGRRRCGRRERSFVVLLELKHEGEMLKLYFLLGVVNNRRSTEYNSLYECLCFISCLPACVWYFCMFHPPWENQVFRGRKS